MNFTLLRRKALRPIFFIVTLMLSASLSAQNIKTYTSADSLKAGDVFNFSILTQLNKEYDRIQFPDTSAFPGELELVGQQQFKLSTFSDSLSYRIQFFATEDVIIPPLPVLIISKTDTTQLFTKPVQLYFKTVLPKEAQESEFKPLKNIFDFPRLIWPWLLAALALAAGLIWWFFYREEEEFEEIEEVSKPVVFHNPLEELENDLQQIRQNTRIAETKDFKLFYSQVSDAIRTYYEDLYQIPALESTTRELLRYLEAYGVDHEMTDTTRKVLNRSDMVKFAKFTPTLDDAWKTYDLAIHFRDRARQVDSGRISRLKREFNQQFNAEKETIIKEGVQ
ncbi:MAG: hypothetical protein FH748_06330 [Balneolaceae bacterium]|nr:hypothetical protein [Balneolaceae bacterium]